MSFKNSIFVVAFFSFEGHCYKLWHLLLLLGLTEFFCLDYIVSWLVHLINKNLPCKRCKYNWTQVDKSMHLNNGDMNRAFYVSEPVGVWCTSAPAERLLQSPAPEGVVCRPAAFTSQGIVTNEVPQAPFQTYWIRIYILRINPGDSHEY